MASVASVILSILCVALSSIAFHHYFLLRNQPNEPPLVKGSIPFLGCALSFQSGFRSFLFECRRKYGGIFTIYVAGKRIHVISDPVNGIPCLYRSHNFGFKQFGDCMRRKLFLNTEEEVGDNEMTRSLDASAVSHLLASEATGELVDRMVSQLDSTTQQFMDAVGDGWKEVDLIEWCYRLVFDLSNYAVMGPNFPKDDEMYRDILEFDEHVINVWKYPEFLQWRHKALSKKMISRLQKFYEGGISPGIIIRKRIDIAQDYGHDAYIPKDLLTVAWASPTNAMPTLFWFLIYLHLTSKEDVFRSEILRYVKNPHSSPSASDIDFHGLLTSELLNSGLKETLRLQGHSLSPRDLLDDTVLKIEGKEYVLKKGSLALGPSTLLNWNPDIYDNPSTWQGDRFVEKEPSDEVAAVNGQTTKIDPKHLKIPLAIWGGGSHLCPGRRFATNEMLIIFTIALLWFEFAPPEGHTTFPEPCEPKTEQYGLGVKPPAEPYMVRMRVRGVQTLNT